MRSNLKDLREKAGMTQAQFAEKVGVRPSTVSEWETQDKTIRPCYIGPIRDILESQDPHLFDIDVLGSGRGFSFMDALRRLILSTIGVTLVGNVQVIAGPVIEPDEYLALFGTSIGTWWEWYNQRNFNKLEKELLKNGPVLKRLATTVSPFQCMAASLAVQAKILQILLTTHKMYFREREACCVEAVHFGALSGDQNLHAIALDWQANTYTICYRQPQTAIPLLNDALSSLNSDTSPLTRSAIYSNFSVAYAQGGDETKARNYIELTYMAMSNNPELDPFYQCIQWNHSVLDDIAGRVYLHLAEHLPDSDYAQQAYDAFDSSKNKNTISQSTKSAVLIKKADAARALGDMDEYVTCLTEGFRIAVEIDSLNRMSLAHNVMGRIPQAWQTEEPIQELHKDISHALVVARR